jgi:nucleoside-diphosphate-sugar epimerase
VKVFVTGGSGFVGQALVRALVARGEQVVAMSRSERSDGVLRGLGAEPVRGDLDSVSSEALQGCEAVIHAGAHVEEWGPWEVFERINVRGTERLLLAARQAGVRRFVHVGTEAALFDGRALVQLDETAPLAVHSPFPYSRSKALAEAAVLAANAPGFSTIVIRPRLVWGPGDSTVLPVLVEAARQGRFAWPDGGQQLTSTTHLHNLVHALQLALRQGRGGQAYFVLDGPPVPMRSFLSRYAATTGADLGERSVPGWLLRGVAALTEPVFSLVGRKPPLTRFTAAMTSREVTLKDDKARKELGYTPVITMDQGLEALRASC